MLIQEIFRYIIVGIYINNLISYLGEFSLFSPVKSLLVLKLLISLTFIYMTLKIKFDRMTDLSFKAKFINFSSIVLPSFFNFQSNDLSSSPIPYLLLLLGSSMSLISILYLGDNYDILPAYKGITKYGPYGKIRHPLYTSYIIFILGALYSNFNFQNILVFISIVTCLILRSNLEEKKMIMTNFAYEEYMKQVKFKFIPWVY